MFDKNNIKIGQIYESGLGNLWKVIAFIDNENIVMKNVNEPEKWDNMIANLQDFEYGWFELQIVKPETYIMIGSVLNDKYQIKSFSDNDITIVRLDDNKELRMTRETFHRMFRLHEINTDKTFDEILKQFN